MARKSIRDLRIEAEIAEKREAEAEAESTRTGKKTTKKTTSRKKAPAKRASRAKKSTAAPRRRLMWAVYNGSMKEEARFHYHELELAEEKLEALRAKSKKQLYFIQPMKVPIAEAASSAEEE